MPTHPLLRLSLTLAIMVFAFPYPIPAQTKASPQPVIILPKSGFEPRDLAIIVNDFDPMSQAIGDSYQKKRAIPLENIIHVRFNPANACWDSGQTVMKPSEFLRIKAEVDQKTPKHVQAFALTWIKPYRVGKMSITTAFAAGHNEAFTAKGCQPTKLSSYFNSESSRPFEDFGLRPTMVLAGTSLEEINGLIERGIASDGTWPDGTAYLVDTGTNDPRNIRSRLYSNIAKFLNNELRIFTIKGSHLEGKKDVLFYFIGKASVDKITSNTFLPGAVADHLTSLGGELPNGKQMSCLRWIEAGATGSYGAVIEPCNFPQKFPHPGVVMGHYVRGETLIEAYWKSVSMPGQGIFIGEPLANPFKGAKVHIGRNEMLIKTRSLKPGLYSVMESETGLPPYRSVLTGIWIGPGIQEILIKEAKSSFYILTRIGPNLGQASEKP